jgi:hypothetical protein
MPFMVMEFLEGEVLGQRIARSCSALVACL